MTALAATVGGDAGEANVRRMLAAAAHRGANNLIVWSHRTVVLGCAAARLQSSPRQSSFADAPDGSAIVFDGRLDNRDDLAAALSLDRGASDAAIALAAWRKGAEAAPARLLGDFAFVLWDAARERVVGARDVFGQRPLFYTVSAGASIIASEPQQILAHQGVPRIPNEGLIAEYLTGRPQAVEETVWTGVLRLRPAHLLACGGGRATATRYWDFDPEARIVHARDEGYADQFNSLLREAIACRTSDVSRVGVFLSGGLDSSAVAAVAALRARDDAGPAVSAFSLTFPGLPVDESRYIDAVTQQWALPSVRLVAQPPTRQAIEAEIDRYRDLPAGPHGAILDPLRRRAVNEVDVALTGYGGDDWFTGSPLHTADLLRQGRVIAAVRQLRQDARLPGRGYGTGMLLRGAVSPLLSSSMRGWLRPIAGARPETYPWIRPEFAARVELATRTRRTAIAPFGTLVQGEVRAIANSRSQVVGDELEDRAAAAAGLEQRHPFNDRRLAEFGFALPEHLRWAGGETKVVLRRALAASLPELVRMRNDKAEFTPTFVETIERLGGRAFFARLAVADAGWVDRAAVERTYDEMRRLYSRGDEAYIRLADAVWSVAAVELWFNRTAKERPQ